MRLICLYWDGNIYITDHHKGGKASYKITYSVSPVFFGGVEWGAYSYMHKKKSGSIFTNLLTITLKNGDQRAESENKDLHFLRFILLDCFNIFNDYVFLNNF